MTQPKVKSDIEARVQDIGDTMTGRLIFKSDEKYSQLFVDSKTNYCTYLTYQSDPYIGQIMIQKDKILFSKYDGTNWDSQELLHTGNINNQLDGRYVNTSGDTMTGILNFSGNKFFLNDEYVINLNNSDIIGANSIYFQDTANSGEEGLCFIRSNNNYDRFSAYEGEFIFQTNMAKTNTSRDNWASVRINKNSYKSGYVKNTYIKIPGNHTGSTSGSISYVYLGQWSTTQNGKKLAGEFYLAQGFNASPAQNFILKFQINTSNNTPDSTWGYFCPNAWILSDNTYAGGHQYKLYYNTISAGTVDIYLEVPSYCNGFGIIRTHSEDGFVLSNSISSTEPTYTNYIIPKQIITSIGGQTINGSLTATNVYGAVWNDYAEYRIADSIEPGRVVIEHESGSMKLSTERLQPGAEIISDTFGFAIGETEESKTPIAVSGRVLAYPYEDRYSYPLGSAVCSGPNGTISLMTREEIREYPERIIGTVSEIPEYEEWGTGKVKVNGRIWIRVK